MFYLVLIPLHLSAHHAATSNTLAAIPWIQAYFSDLFDRESHTHTLVDSLALSIFLIAAVGCLALSAWFHAVQCTTKDRCERAHRGDYVGIVILIEGSFWPCLYYGKAP
jgi:adiponectin receptor